MADTEFYEFGPAPRRRGGALAPLTAAGIAQGGAWGRGCSEGGPAKRSAR
jgi:hypothetical protein